MARVEHTPPVASPRVEPLGTKLRVRVWLPDRPGALGLVASRIGSLGADIVGIDVLERGVHVAVDEFSVVLPDPNLIELLIREIGEVDGAAVEQFVVVDNFADPRIDALATVEALLERAPTDQAGRDAVLLERVLREFGADWAARIRADGSAVRSDAAPEADQLIALAEGTTASPLVARGEHGPADLLVAKVGDRGALLVGRSDPPIRHSERQQLLALARIVARLG